MNLPLSIPATTPRTATVIFLHGLGHSDVAWYGMIQWMALQLPSIGWVIPNAPTKPVGYYAGQHRPSWFDIQILPPGHDEWDEAGIVSSVAYVEALIQAEIHRGADPRRIILMGFSQGAALSLLVALKTTHELGGVISLSGWIPHKGRDQIALTEPHVPIFCGQGKDDTEIPMYYSEEAIGFLRNVLHFQDTYLTVKHYEGLDHTVNSTEIHDVVAWIQRILHLRSTTTCRI
ncbi:Phospholipase/carboxylesterase [Lactarius hatsudake]|nr:Phospholipase/carboxylesterase [Lactarius hatsudake]